MGLIQNSTDCRSVLEPVLLEHEPVESGETVLTPAIVQATMGELISLLDPAHRSLSDDLRYDILHAKYRQELLADCMESGNAVLHGGQAYLSTFQTLEVFQGFVFEAFMVRLMKNRMSTVGRNALVWCSDRQQAKPKYWSQFFPIGTGHVSTRAIHPVFHSPSANMDIMFIRKMHKAGTFEPLVQLGSSNIAGIQVKAITGNEKSEIIQPLISGKYTHVLTCLRRRNGLYDRGKHSFEVCMGHLRAMYRAGEITEHQKAKLERSIISPEGLGIDQREVDEYQEYIANWYSRRANPDHVIEHAIGMEAKMLGWNSEGRLVLC